jgi:hypothetical protein
MVGDPAYRAPDQRSNIHGNGVELYWDALLGCQGNIHKRLTSAPESMSTWRDLDWSFHSRTSRGRRKIINKTHQSNHSNE